MGVVIKKLPHPYQLTHKGKRLFYFYFFGGGFPREGEKNFFRIARVFFLEFFHSFSIFSYSSLFLSLFFFKNEGVFIEDEENGGLARCNMLHLSQDDMLSIQYISLGIFFSFIVPSSFTIFFGVSEIKNCFKRKPGGG